MNWQTVEKLKADGRYRIAGQLACLLGYDNTYGCHFGLRSTVDTAQSEFRKGWDEISTLNCW